VLCGACVDQCYPRAVELVGREMSVAEAVTEIGRDRPFYEGSGGGITASGGEPLHQLEFVRSLLAACHTQGLHTALDTTACSSWAHLESVLPHTDLVLLDLKVMDADRHRAYTGVDNRLILENARALAAYMRGRAGQGEAGAGRPENQGIWVRVPVVPGITDGDDDLRGIARFVRNEMQGAVKAVELLGYHQLGGSKYQRLGVEPPLPYLQPPSREHLQRSAALVRAEVGPGPRVSAR
jgi:pyruvate formate lyase activating enzyme